MIYCYNCDSEAVTVVISGEDDHRSPMCQTCFDAFQFGVAVGKDYGEIGLNWHEDNPED